LLPRPRSQSASLSSAGCRTPTTALGTSRMFRSAADAVARLTYAKKRTQASADPRHHSNATPISVGRRQMTRHRRRRSPIGAAISRSNSAGTTATSSTLMRAPEAERSRTTQSISALPGRRILAENSVRERRSRRFSAIEGVMATGKWDGEALRLNPLDRRHRFLPWWASLAAHLLQNAHSNTDRPLSTSFVHSQFLNATLTALAA
jgi:hypothetical protein